MQKIILASGSPRRKQLLEAVDLPFEVVVSDADESYPIGMAVDEIPEHIARSKALATAAMTNPHDIIIAADTVVVVDKSVIGKPKDKADAEAMLKRLSGRTHRVLTGVVILQSTEEHAFTEVTEVDFEPMSAAQISHYVDKYHPLDKAGAYAIQEWIGYMAVSGIRGDYYNVMGLPVCRLMQVLRNLLPSGFLEKT